MPIYKGEDKINLIYKGEDPIARVYHGSTLVFQSGDDPPPGGDSHRYWRLNEMVAITGDGYIVFGECYLRESIGGTNKIPVAYAAYNIPPATIDLPPRLYDGDLATYWHSSPGANGDGGNNGFGVSWVAFDYGTEISPAEISLSCCSGNVRDRCPYGLTLEYSDTGLSGPWTKHSRIWFAPRLWNFGETRTRPVPPIPDTPGGHKFWKFGELTSADSYVVTGGIALRETVGGPDAYPVNTYPSGWRTTGNGDATGAASDDSADTYDHSPGGASGTYSFSYEYPGPILPAQIAVEAANNNIVNRTPHAGNIYYSDTSITGPWTLWDSFNVGAGWSGGQVKTENF